MSKIVEPKNYQGKELENIFFRPILSGAGAENIGIRVLYNMPVPTTLNLWRGASNSLRRFETGWSGGAEAEKLQKTIDMRRVKSETGYSAADYYAMIYEHIAGLEGETMDDLSGTVLEEAETQIFRQSLAESLRATMWIGSTERSDGYFDTFDGFLKKLTADNMESTPSVSFVNVPQADWNAADAGESFLKRVWDNAPVELKELKSEGQLAFFVTGDLYAKYEESLDAQSLEAAYIARQQGRPTLLWRGIPVIDMQVSGYMKRIGDLPATWGVLADRRNMALAVNTADFPGTEVRMWYNPDEMQNRQRAVFAAGCDFLLPELISYGIVG